MKIEIEINTQTAYLIAKALFSVYEEFKLIAELEENKNKELIDVFTYDTIESMSQIIDIINKIGVWQ